MIDNTNDTLSKIVAFSINDKEYGVDVQYVVSIEKIMPITRVPNVPSYIKGVINLRGIIIPIIDLRTRFQIEEKPYDEHTRIVIIKIKDKQVGFIVDEAHDVIQISEGNVEAQPDIIGSEKKEYIDGIIKIEDRLLMLLNIEQIMNV
ncbi:chemotaxis protein CheW [Fervidibacillus halotolerans]|uniref:Chemotaxis protein CheW n=1 Tax=Fervidibacillus halotolerans TaxID=2980027 RepID=A0A9E8M243_9BACI|nr:chemotaxis protein CheW [Fervidibacillus halotolerans]WAA13582.1 chemotaxis protein CheW [Fervidibacillus halotolerans]